MQAYKAYYEGGRIIPLGNPSIPEGSEIIITVLDPPTEQQFDNDTDYLLSIPGMLESIKEAREAPASEHLEDIGWDID